MTLQRVRAIDGSREEAGNGRWRKLVMRLAAEGRAVAITRCEVTV